MVDDRARLLSWFRANARELPWRAEPRDPYGVLVSEFMLQQTQVDRVIPKFELFLETFPDFETLAAASEEEVLAVWSGLGYYRRAKMLHRLAREISSGDGVLPTSAKELEKLPGIGPYTAAAVASLAFGEAVPVFDGNVIRVASRILAFGGDPRTSSGRAILLGWVGDLVRSGTAGQLNEALMELGATVCTPTSPRCGGCPLAGSCQAHREGRPEDFPLPRTSRTPLKLRWVAACCIDEDGKWLVRKIEDGPILRGLWLPPIATMESDDDPVTRALGLVPGVSCERPRVLNGVHHSITHRRIEVTPVRLRVRREEIAGLNDRWIDSKNSSIATSSLLDKLFIVNKLDDDTENE